MDEDKIETWIKILTLFGSVIAFAFTVSTWKQRIHVQRAELFESKFKEFEDSTTLMARRILDGYAVCGNCNNDSTNISDKEMVSIASSRVGNKADITLENLDRILNEPLPSKNINNQRIRQSFDSLLDFLGKLDYYVHNNFMTEDEINYFQYYIKKCAKSEAVMAYAKNYSFDPFLSLLRRLKL